MAGDTAFFHVFDEEDAVWSTWPASLAEPQGPRPSRAVLAATQMVEQLVEVPWVSPSSVLPVFVARDGHEWCQVTGFTGVYCWKTQWAHPEGNTAIPGRKTNTGGVTSL